MSNDVVVEDNEIDLLEIFAMIRPALFPALLVGLFFGIAAYFYARTLDREYMAVAQVTIDNTSGNEGSNLRGSLIGLGGSEHSNEIERVTDKVMSRDFIIPLFEVTDIDDDPYFTGEGQAPGLLAKILDNFRELEPPTLDQKHERIVKRFRSVVSVKPSNNGIINVEVRHSDPEQAAEIANAIATTHLDNLEKERREHNAKQLDRMADRLTDAQAKFDAAMEAERLYAVKNSVGSQEELNANSLRMTSFRRELDNFDTMLSVVAYLKEQRNAGVNTIDAAAFSALYPVASTLIQRRLRWDVGAADITLPSLQSLTRLERSLLDERDQIQRTLRVMEEAAEDSADAAGRLAELRREVEVRKVIFGGLISQVEARGMTIELQDKRGEWIQYATAPLSPSAPNIGTIMLLGAFGGAALMVLLEIFRSLRRGTLHTTSRIARVFRKEPATQNIIQSIGSRPKALSSLTKRSIPLDNVGLFDLILSLRDAQVRTLSVLGAPRTAALRNLVTVIASNIAGKEERVAIVDLAKSGDMGMQMYSHGMLVEMEKSPQVILFNWVEQPSGKAGDKAMSLDEALAQLKTSFDRTVIACAPLGRAVLQNNLALDQADHVLLVASKGRTTRRHADRVGKLLSQKPEKPFDLVIA